MIDKAELLQQMTELQHKLEREAAWKLEQAEKLKAALQLLRGSPPLNPGEVKPVRMKTAAGQPIQNTRLWMREYLKAGPRLLTDLRKDAEGAAITYRMLQRARTAEGVVSRNLKAGWSWMYPKDDLVDPLVNPNMRVPEGTKPERLPPKLGGRPRGEVAGEDTDEEELEKLQPLLAAQLKPGDAFLDRCSMGSCREPFKPGQLVCFKCGAYRPRPKAVGG